MLDVRKSLALSFLGRPLIKKELGVEWEPSTLNLRAFSVSPSLASKRISKERDQYSSRISRKSKGRLYQSVPRRIYHRALAR